MRAAFSLDLDDLGDQRIYNDRLWPRRAMSIDQENSSSNTTAPMQNGLAALCAIGTVLLIWGLLKYSAYGIDFTDESFYLVWIANPFIYDGSITQFGFVYHPLYRLLGGDIAALRQVNILLTFALAWGLQMAKKQIRAL